MKRNKWSKELFEDLHYTQQLSLEEIANRYDIKTSSVRGLMTYYSVPVRHQKNQWSYELLYDLYHSQNLSTGDIAKMYKCSYITIQSQLVYYGIPLRSRAAAAQLRDGEDRYNESFFDGWSPEFAWYLGWMFTDGSVSQDLREANLSLKDKDACKQVAALLGPGVSVRSIKNLWRVGVYRKDLVKKLVDYGLTPNKTHTLTFPDVPKEYLPHFVRGVWDGDGCLRVESPSYGRRHHVLVASFGCASHMFISELISVIHTETGIPMPRLTKSKTKEFWSFSLWNKRSVSLCHWLYRNSTPEIRLKRKYEKYLIVKDGAGNSLPHG